MASVIDMTPAAQAHITTILGANPGQHLRVSISNRGCSGHKYHYELRPWDSAGPMDEIIDWPDGRMVIDGLSLFGLIGSRLDLREDRFETQLIWENPMAVNACGCGESFGLSTDVWHDH